MTRCRKSLWGGSRPAYPLGLYFKEQLLVSAAIIQDLVNKTNQKEKTEKLFQADSYYTTTRNNPRNPEYHKSGGLSLSSNLY